MASHVMIVLREDVDNLGKTGELVRVRPGYARNYLLPRGMATLATSTNVQQIEHARKAALARAAKLRTEAEGVAAALAEVSVVVAKHAGEEGRLFGSVTAAEVADALKAKGYDIDRRKIQMPDEPIRQVGTYEVGAKLTTGVTATIKIDVQPTK